MRLLKPNWVSHDGKPIFSIDIHPDGSRFATGGQGDNSGKVVIWNMAPVKEEKSEKDDSVPKLLCTMDNHLGCVNTVRWSNNGTFLASAGDDKLIIVWQHSKYGGMSTAFGSGGKVVNIEQWRAQSTLRGHSGDVLDIAWSPHDAWLASCSVDNTIVIWNTKKLPEQIAVLRGHTGLVKGVTWDPVGKYLASQSDDKTLRIWRTRDWQEEECITEPFRECGGTTHVLRLNWSPSGQFVVSAHAMNNAGPVAQIIERDGWKTAMDFVGHRKAVTVVRFNPNIFSRRKGEKVNSKTYCCCAVGSRDRTLSVWLTALKRPLVVVHDLFTNSVLDISWSSDGLQLLCCSWDGSVAFVEFDAQEIGTPLSESGVTAMLEETYGKSLLGAQRSSHVIESADILTMHQQQQEREKERRKRAEEAKRMRQAAAAAHSNISNSRLSFSSGGTPVKGSNKQIETRTKDGKRRITPILLVPVVADEQECPAPFTSCQPTFSSSTEQSKIEIDKSLSPFKTNETDRSLAKMLAGGSIMAGATTPQSGAKTTGETSTISKTPEEKAATSGTLNTQVSPIQSLSPSSQRKTPEAPSSLASTSLVERSTEKDKRDARDRLKLAVKHKFDTPAVTPSADGAPPKKKDGRGRPRKDRTLAAQQAAVSAAVAHAAPQPVAQREVSRVVYSTSHLSLPVPSVEKAVSKQISGAAGSEAGTVLEIENNVGASSDSTVHKMRCVTAGRPVWDSVFTSRILTFAGNSQVVCVATEDASISLLSAGSGRRLQPHLVLESKASTVRCSGAYVMVITTRGNMFVWNTQSMKAVIKNESLVSIIPNKETTVTSTLLTTQGLPVLTLSNSKSYSYQLELGCWVLLTSKNDLLHLTSDHQTCVPSSESLLQGPLSTLQAANHKSGSQASRLHRTNVHVQQSATLSHIENQLACSLTLRSANEYHFWLLTYARYCAQEGLESKLREVCDDLLGPAHRRQATSTWQHSVLGHKKRSLLEEILPILGSNLQLQRLYSEYKDQLDTIR